MLCVLFCYISIVPLVMIPPLSVTVFASKDWAVGHGVGGIVYGFCKTWRFLIGFLIWLGHMQRADIPRMEGKFRKWMEQKQKGT